jgi:ATP-dependent DNA helicase DinG
MDFSQVSGYIKNFPFAALREKQSSVLKQIDTALASGYRPIILEAPTGFGKSAVAITVALTLGTSYICTSTKDLQTQYSRDFPFLKVAKGKNNFICPVKEDFIKNGTYKCGLDSNNTKCCFHTSAAYGPCINNQSFRHDGCKYRTSEQDYRVNNRGTRDEEVFIDDDTINYYRNKYSQWSHPENLKKELRVWRRCGYYDQLNIALVSSQAILNYPIFLAYLTNRKGLPARSLLVLDEAHRLEEEIVKFTEISISKRRWKRYIPNLEIVNYGFDDVEGWIDFLIDLERQMLDLTEDISEELAAEAKTDAEKLKQTIDNILSNRERWIVSEIKEENDEVTNVKLKPLDVTPFCKHVFGLCDKILMMSATILDKDAFCTSLGLAPEEVKFIQVASDFPLQNRPICPLNIAYLNSDSLKLQDVQIKIASAIDNLMTLHRNEKGIIHTTSYKQLDFIKQNISQENKRRLLETNSEIQRDEVIAEHVNSTKPTVLISPSLYTGLDLKDHLSRFQIIVKVPYPDLGDRWINEKRKKNRQWYIWQTALRLVQGYGRSIRSKDDWAKTYVLDSVFENFVTRNKNILPDWFTQAVQPGLLKATLGHVSLDSDSSKVLTPFKENHNPVTSNHHNPSFHLISEQTLKQNVNNTTEKNEIASTPSKTLGGLDRYIKDESNRQERFFTCPYCHEFKAPSEIEYQRHMVLKHRGKSGYPNMAVVR